jgi:uncharacterized RDD family membrane protein YckC
MVYDTFLVLPLVMVSVAIALGLQTLVLGPPAEGEVVQMNAYLVRLVALGTAILFYSWFWIKNGQTLGMQAWRIKLVTFAGEAPGARASVLRCVGALLSAACLGLGYLWCLVDRRGRYWHDYLSQTELVLLPKREKKKTKG